MIQISREERADSHGFLLEFLLEYPPYWNSKMEVSQIPVGISVSQLSPIERYMVSCWNSCFSDVYHGFYRFLRSEVPPGTPGSDRGLHGGAGPSNAGLRGVAANNDG